MFITLVEEGAAKKEATYYWVMTNADFKCIYKARTSFLLFPFESVLLALPGKFLLLLLVHVAVQMFAGVAECGRHQDLSVLAQLVSDSDQEVLQLHSIFKDLRVCPARGMEEGGGRGERGRSKGELFFVVVSSIRVS